jgi:enamine deaminase RidA (YjgF/YER057c/UK114 family)
MKQLIIISLLFIAGCSIKSPETKVAEKLYDYDVEMRIKELGIELAEPGAPIANYVNSVRTGNLVFMSGKGPRNTDGTSITGKVGSDLTIDEGYAAAKQTAIQQLGALKAEIGDLNKVVRIVKVLGMVNAEPDFTDQPKVINGFSDLMVAVFGDRGKHARAAVGMGSLPSGIACEIEMIVEVQD